MLRIAVGSVVHEANTFSPRLLDWEEIQSFPYFVGDEVIEHAKRLESAIPGFLALEEHVEWVPLVSSALPGGSGQITQRGFTGLVKALTSRVAAAGALDACLLSIGGGMVVDGKGLEDADGHLLASVRAALPERCRLGVAVDMHANMTQRMIDASDVLLAYQTFPPHWDKREVGLAIARLVARAARGEIDPVMALVAVPMLLQPERQSTLHSPMRDVLDDAGRAAASPGVLAVSMIPGFGWCDVQEAGASVVVVADRDRDLADRTAADLAQRWFDRRDAFRFPLVPIAEAVDRASRHQGKRPLLLCDHSDNVGAGGAGDATALLAALLEQPPAGVAVATICDPAAVALCAAAGVGSDVEIALGGKRDPRQASPLHVHGRVKLLSDGVYRNTGRLWPGQPGQLGRCAVLIAGGIEIIVSEQPSGGSDPAIFQSNGIEPAERSVIVIKSQIFGPASYGDLVDEHVVVDGDGLATSNFARFRYQKLRRPIFPLDPEVGFDATAVRTALTGARPGR